MAMQQQQQQQLGVVLVLLLVVMMLGLLELAGCQSDDVECLREMKSSVMATGEYLQSWDFGDGGGGSNGTAAAPPNICNFIGVQCLHPSEIKVYSLSLPGAGLRGTFPRGLEKCGSLTGLDLSSNALTGPIPASICEMLPYLVKLDLSQNNITGPIPEGLASCVYLNELRLQRNELEGPIPGQIGLLARLRDFNVADNRLTGAIPYTFSSRPSGSSGGGQQQQQTRAAAGFPEGSFEGNEGLCGPPLPNPCKAGSGSPSGERRARSRAGAAMAAGVAVGGTVALLAVSSICIWLLFGQKMKMMAAGGKMDEEDALDNAWLRRIKAPSAVVVSMFEQPLVKIRLSDLAAATGGFAREAVIGVGQTGVFYRATLRDGSMLAIKRLRRAALVGGGERQFRTEMEALAKVRHRNLVPMLGYCVGGNERLVVYKHMLNGSLRSRLHGLSSEAADDEKLDWGARLRIAVGAARGLAWLHHSCSPRLVHRGITSSSILLDEDLEPRITDFGLAKLVNISISTDEDDAGYYLAPEDYSQSKSSRAAAIPAAVGATPKGDVYSFGVVLLELVTGRRPADNGGAAGGDGDSGAAGRGRRSLVEWIGELFKSGHVSDAVDKSLVAATLPGGGDGGAGAGAGSDSSSSGSGRRREVMQVMKIACSCVLSFPKERPSMYEVYHMLRAVGEDYYPAAAAAEDQRQLYHQRHRQQRSHHHPRQQLRQHDDEDEIPTPALAENDLAIPTNATEQSGGVNGVQMQRLNG